MASWGGDMPDPNAGDPLAYTEAWENRITDGDVEGVEEMIVQAMDGSDVEYADEDEAGQLGLGVPGEQRAITGLAKSVDTADEAEAAYLEGQDGFGAPAPEDVREMFRGFGWGVTE